MRNKYTYRESFYNLYHGTDINSANMIIKNGFIVRKSKNNWCGNGVYFYDIKSKAWWSANRTCRKIKKEKNKIVEPTIVIVDIINIFKEDIFDMRSFKDLCEFEEAISPMLKSIKLEINDITDITERNIKLRATLISFFAKENNKKIVIGHFKQKPQSKYKNAISFANNLDIVFGIETIYCVKDISIIENIRNGANIYNGTRNVTKIY